MRARRLDLAHLIIFPLLGVIQFESKQVLEFLPNVELVSTLIMVCTLVYRRQALIPIYLFVFLEGLLAGFGLWWYPYLYLWLILWAWTMILPKRMKPGWQVPVYAWTCALFGLVMPAWAEPVTGFISTVYLHGLTMMIYPLVFCSLVCGRSLRSSPMWGVRMEPSGSSSCQSGITERTVRASASNTMGTFSS